MNTVDRQKTSQELLIVCGRPKTDGLLIMAKLLKIKNKQKNRDNGEGKLFEPTSSSKFYF